MTLALLSPEEVYAAERCAERRLADALAAHMTDRFGEDSAESHYWGAAGELVVARHIGVTWRAGSREGAIADVGRYEVRAIRPGTSPYLKTKANDPPYRAIAVVLFEARDRAVILGWTDGSTIRRLGVHEDPGGRGAPAWFLRDLAVLDEEFPETRPIVVATRFPLERLPDGTIRYRPVAAMDDDAVRSGGGGA